MQRAALSAGVRSQHKSCVHRGVQITPPAERFPSSAMPTLSICLQCRQRKTSVPFSSSGVFKEQPSALSEGCSSHPIKSQSHSVWKSPLRSPSPTHPTNHVPQRHISPVLEHFQGHRVHRVLTSNLNLSWHNSCPTPPHPILSHRGRATPHLTSPAGSGTCTR